MKRNVYILIILAFKPRPMRKNNVASSDKLFNFILSNYLNSPLNEPINPIQIPNDLLKFCKEFNLAVFKGTNWVLYDPETFFKVEDLEKLKGFRVKLAGIKDEIRIKRVELDIFGEEEISLEYKNYMETLHRYNEAKDKAQALMGRLAQLSGTTTKDLYPKFNLVFDD